LESTIFMVDATCWASTMRQIAPRKRDASDETA